MDPVTAVGLASSIITFVEFAWNLVGGAVGVYRSKDGILAENARLDDVRDDLDSLANSLSASPSCNTRAERKIARIAEDCHADSKTLQNFLREIAGPGNNRALWKSLRASWVRIRKRKDVAELKTRLQEYRSEVLVHVALLVREDQSSLNLGISKLRAECSQLKIGLRTQITSTQNKVLRAIDTLAKSNDESQRSNEICFADISKMLLAIQAAVADTHFHHRILRQLVFEDMNSRANQIPKAAQNTYSWAVKDDPVNQSYQRRQAWKVVPEWLRAGDRILHVSGNPGSGKSTLMKFVSQHGRTKQELQAWAGTDKLVLCVFYFWKPGSRMQRTLTGLYRSLLFQALSQCPELTEEVFPAQFRLMKDSIGDTMVQKIQSFDECHIEEAFKSLMSRASSGGYRFCLFIDGLDESEGERLRHEELSNMLQNWVASSAVKICVSSRPYSEFLEPLNLPGNRLIRLHELNESDIKAYCVNRLENDVYAQKRGTLCRRLVPIVVDHAQGVFLWVHLVIDVLLVGFLQEDPDSALEAQLEELPSDLDKLYTKLREPIESNRIYRDRSNRMLLLAAHNPQSPYHLTAMAFSWLDGQDRDQGGLMNPEFPPASGRDAYSDEEIEKRLDHVKKQIDGLARGFLEVWKDKFSKGTPFFAFKVRFCHRTAQDYLLQNEDRRCALLKSFPGFENSQTYVRILLAELIHGYKSVVEKVGLNVFRCFDMPFCHNIDPDLASRFELPLKGRLVPTEMRLFSWALVRASHLHCIPAQVSFRAHAAYCGLNRFVIREVSRDAKKLDETSNGGNLALAAVYRRNFKLASMLMTMGRAMNEPCVVFQDDGVQLLVPACVIAIAFHLSDFMPISKTGQIVEHDQVELFKELVRLSLGMNISMWATISWYPSIEYLLVQEIPGMPVRIAVADTIQHFGTPPSGSNGCSSRPPTSRATGVVQDMSSDKAGWVEGQVVDAVRWLIEWLHQTHIEPGQENKLADRRLHLEKIEWSSDTQELVELSGQTRLW